MATQSSILGWEIPGIEGPGPFMGSRELDTTEGLSPCTHPLLSQETLLGGCS